MRNVFVKKLTLLAKSNPKIMFITGDLGFGVFDEFAKEFPNQYLNVGVAEQNMIGIATGLALGGRIVFVYSIGNFATLRCLEQIRNDACYHEANVKIVSIGGGFNYGQLGMSHHATEDLAILRALPNMTVFAPGTAEETEFTTEAAAKLPGVCYLRLEKLSAEDQGLPIPAFSVGKASVSHEGTDAILISTGGILGAVLRAATILEQQGVSCKVLNIHCLKPLDSIGIIEHARNSALVVTVEEHSVIGGLGGAVAETLMEAGVYPQRFVRIGIQDTYSAVVGSQNYLRNFYGIDEEAIVSKTLSAFQSI